MILKLPRWLWWLVPRLRRERRAVKEARQAELEKAMLQSNFGAAPGRVLNIDPGRLMPWAPPRPRSLIGSFFHDAINTYYYESKPVDNKCKRPPARKPGLGGPPMSHPITRDTAGRYTFTFTPFIFIVSDFDGLTVFDSSRNDAITNQWLHLFEDEDFRRVLEQALAAARGGTVAEREEVNTRQTRSLIRENIALKAELDALKGPPECPGCGKTDC